MNKKKKKNLGLFVPNNVCGNKIKKEYIILTFQLYHNSRIKN